MRIHSAMMACPYVLGAMLLHDRAPLEGWLKLSVKALEGAGTFTRCFFDLASMVNSSSLTAPP